MLAQSETSDFFYNFKVEKFRSFGLASNQLFEYVTLFYTDVRGSQRFNLSLSTLCGKVIAAVFFIS